MARVKAMAVGMMPMPMTAQPPMPKQQAMPKQPHGMSLTVKPQRMPHPTAKGRDTFGRMMPGQLPANAAPPFTSKPMAIPVRQAAPRAPRTMAPPKPAPIARPMMPPRGY